MNVVLLEPDEIGPGPDVRLTGTRADHLRSVLRISPGQTIRVGVVDGPLGTATITGLDEAAVTMTCAFEGVPPLPPVDLLLALPRPKVMRRLWAQIAAIGAGRILLTNAARVERDYFDTHILEPASYRPLLIEGLQQARDTRCPQVSIHRRFKVLVEDALDPLVPASTRLLADPAATTTIGTAIEDGRAERVLLAVGPEGGWNDFERALLEAHGFRAVAMGTRTLRTDTACVALLALVHDALRTRQAG